MPRPLTFRAEVLSTIHELLAFVNGSFPRDRERTIPVPQDIPELLSIARRAAENLMLCPSMDSAKAVMKEDLEAATAFAFVMAQSGLHWPLLETALDRVQTATEYKLTLLPCYAPAAVLIELCDGLRCGEWKD
jgi:hypothetical protein